MKVGSYFSISKGVFFPVILLLAVLGIAASVNAQQVSRVTVLKDFCASIGASNTCNGIPASFPSSVTFDVSCVENGKSCITAARPAMDSDTPCISGASCEPVSNH